MQKAKGKVVRLRNWKHREGEKCRLVQPGKSVKPQMAQSNGEHPHRETQEENGEALAFTQGDTRCKVCAHISVSSLTLG